MAVISLLCSLFFISESNVYIFHYLTYITYCTHGIFVLLFGAGLKEKKKKKKNRRQTLDTTVNEKLSISLEVS